LTLLTRWPFASLPEQKARWLIFAGVFALALAFAAYTRHAWEDYYITYRVSKNLATGHGLVYRVGERLHVFTSPLNVLVPAALSLLTGNKSDELVLWLFRGVSSALLAGAAVLLFNRVFDASERLASYRWLPGRGYVTFDSQFVVFKRNQTRGTNAAGRQE